MRPRQIAIIWVATLLVVGMALYAPWACVGRQGTGPAAGYHWLFAPPEGECLAANVDFPRLLIQWVVVGVLATASYLAWPTPFFAWLSKKWGKPGLFPLAVIGCVLWLIYIVCEALQPWAGPALPRWMPKWSSHWLFIDVFLLVILSVGAVGIVNDIKREMSRIPGSPTRRLVLGLLAFLKNIDKPAAS